MANRILDRGDFIGERFSSESAAGFLLSRWTWNADGRAVEPHGHSEAHLMVITSGRFVTEAEGRADPASLPLVYNPPQTYHRDRFEAGPSSFFSISVPAEAGLPLDQLGLPLCPTRFDGIGARAAVHRLMRELSLWSPDSGAVAEALCLDLLQTLPGGRLPERTPPRWTKVVLEALRESAVDPSLDQLASVAGVHKVHLARSFRRHLGCTPGEYRRTVKLERSAEWLLTSRKPLAEIAIDAGFFDQPHFARLFKLTYGVTPARFRSLAG